jgi:hypothetical protein
MPPTLSPTTAVPAAAVAGWSYGGDLASDLTGSSRAGRLVYVLPRAGTDAQHRRAHRPARAAVPQRRDRRARHRLVAARPDEVASRLRQTQRRLITRQAWLAGPWREARRTVPIGRSDQSIPAEKQRQLRTQLDDVRVVDRDPNPASSAWGNFGYGPSRTDGHGCGSRSGLARWTPCGRQPSLPPGAMMEVR